MTLEDALRQTNRNLIAFDLVLGSAAIVAPAATLLWSRSPAFSRRGARGAMWLAGAFNLAAALGFGWLARRR